MIAVIKSTLKALLEHWQSITLADRIAILVLVVTVAGLIVGVVVPFVIDSRQRRRERGRQTFLKEILTDELELAKRTLVKGAISNALETFLPRIAVDTQLSFRTARLVLYGPSGIGKSRFAVELVRRLRTSRPTRQICQFSGTLPPMGTIEGLRLREAIFVIDDVRPKHNKPDEAFAHFGKNLLGLLERVRAAAGYDENTSANIVITVHIDYVDWLRDELDGMGFSFVQIPSPGLNETAEYIRRASAALKISAMSNPAAELLSQQGNFGDIFDLLLSFRQQGKLSLDLQDVQTALHESVQQRFQRLLPQEQFIFRALSLMDELALPMHSNLVEQLFVAAIRKTTVGRLTLSFDETWDAAVPMGRRYRFRGLRHLYAAYNNALWRKLQRSDRFCARRCRHILRTLESRGHFSLDEGKVLCDPPVLKYLQTQFTSHLESELQLLLDILLNQSSSHIPPRLKFDILWALGEALYKNQRYNDAIRLDRFLLTFSDKAMPSPSHSVRSQLHFFIGFNLYTQDKELWDDAIVQYRKSLEFDPNNLYAKHALSTIYTRTGHHSDALALCREIAHDNPNDILTHKTILEMYIRGSAGWQDVRASYLVVGRYGRLAKTPSRPSQALPIIQQELLASALLIRARASLAWGERSQPTKSQHRYFTGRHRTERLFRQALEAATGRYEESATRLYYGSYLFDVVRDSSQALDQLTKARDIQRSYKRRKGRSGHDLFLNILDKITEISANSGQLAESIADLEEISREDPTNHRALWFVGRGYEAAYRYGEAFQAFWTSAEAQQLPVLFSQLRSIVGDWQYPAIKLTERPTVMLPGLKWQDRSKCFALVGELPSDEILDQVSETELRSRLVEFFSTCRKVRNGLHVSGLDDKRIAQLRLKCSQRAYELDQDGAINLRNLTDYALDLLRTRSLSEARRLFEKADELRESRGQKVCFELWHIGECIELEEGKVTSEAARYYIRSATMENTSGVYLQLRSKLETCTGKEKLALYFLNIVNQMTDKVRPLRAFTSIFLAPVWKDGKRLAPSFIKHLTSFQRNNPEVSQANEIVGIALLRNGRPRDALRHLLRFQNSDNVFCPSCSV